MATVLASNVAVWIRWCNGYRARLECGSVGICLQLFLNIGVSKSFGLFFIQFLVAYNTTASLLSVVIATQTAAFKNNIHNITLDITNIQSDYVPIYEEESIELNYLHLGCIYPCKQSQPYQWCNGYGNHYTTESILPHSRRAR
jgi:hypothetical protein